MGVIGASPAVEFWRILLAYLIVAVEVLLFLALSVIVGVVFGFLAELAVQWRDPTLLRRLVLWVMVVILALLTAVAWVAPLVLICGCQAYIYRAIVQKPTVH